MRNACNAGELDAVIFTGSGTTGAVHKLIQALKLEAPVVFVGPGFHRRSLLTDAALGDPVRPRGLPGEPPGRPRKPRERISGARNKEIICGG